MSKICIYIQKIESMYFEMNWTEAFRNVSKMKIKKWKKSEETWKEIDSEILLKLNGSIPQFFRPPYLHKDIRYIIYNLVRFLTYKQFDI